MHAYLPIGRIANGGNVRGMNAVSGIKRLSRNPLRYLINVYSTSGSPTLYCLSTSSSFSAADNAVLLTYPAGFLCEVSSGLERLSSSPPFTVQW